MSDDPRWPRASAWLASGFDHGSLTVLGVPAFRTSLSPTRADTTPAAIREALRRFSTYSVSHGVDVSELAVRDMGDVHDPDGPDGEKRVREALGGVTSDTVVALGGDNSITFSVLSGLAGSGIRDWGLVTLDAHFDLRDGRSNGSPVRRLIQSGLSGQRVVQVGIADFSNSASYAARARELGITVISRREVAVAGIASVFERAMAIAGANGCPVHVDLDVDVCDRAVAPACPASAPGGLSAAELRDVAFLAGCHGGVRSIDVTEIDAEADSADGRTVRLGALLLLEFAAGMVLRTTSRS